MSIILFLIPDPVTFLDHTTKSSENQVPEAVNVSTNEDNLLNTVRINLTLNFTIHIYYCFFTFSSFIFVFINFLY